MLSFKSISPIVRVILQDSLELPTPFPRVGRIYNKHYLETTHRFKAASTFDCAWERAGAPMGFQAAVRCVLKLGGSAYTSCSSASSSRWGT